MTSANLTREETAARAQVITLDRVRVELDLTTASDLSVSGFRTTTTLTFTATTGATWVDFIGEAVHRVTVNGAEVAAEYDGARIALTGLGRENTVTIEATGTYSRSGEGLHRFHDPVDDACYLYTQYEPADARRVMACFEQPDLKARYTFVVHAPAEWQVLSNQSVATRDVTGDTQRVEFAETLPLSSYITAVAAGPYRRFDAEWQRGEQHVALGILARASMADFVEVDELVTVTQQGLDFFTEAFGYPYPWGSYDQIFVPEYNLGAMENPGLVTFNEAYLSRGERTDAERAALTNTVLHEMAHMWFGDLVTMTWWDDLWLKESFADYMGSHASVAATRFRDGWAAFAAGRKAWAYVQDQLPTTHPIVADITDLEAAKLNFDGITYAKGAAVLKQLVAFVGEDAFFRGAQEYFRAHAFGNTTLRDLLVHLEQASGRDLQAWADAWLATTGMSTMHLEADAAGTLAVVQDVVRPHRLRVGFYDVIGDRLQRVDQRELDLVSERAVLDRGRSAVVLVNDADLTYAKVRLDDASLAVVSTHLTTLDDAVARALIWSALHNATRDGELSARRALDITMRQAPLEPYINLQTLALREAQATARRYVTEGERDAVAREWLLCCAEALDTAEPGSDAQIAWARAFATAASYDGSLAARVRELLTDAGPAGLTVGPELRWSLLTALVTTSNARIDDIAAEAERDATASGKTAAIQAAASRPLAEVRLAAWESAWTDTALSNDVLDATIAGVRAGGRRDLIAERDGTYFAGLVEIWRTRSIEIAKRLVVGLFPATETLDAVDAWLAENTDAPQALRRIVLEQRDHRARDLRVQQAQATLT